MKIGFIGTGGTGKTTVLDRVALEFNLPKFKSVARMVYERLGIENEEAQFKMSLEEKWHLQRTILDTRREVEAENVHNDFIADRTMLDHLAYTLYRCGDVITDDQWVFYFGVTSGILTHYDLFFYFPLVGGHHLTKNDDFRQSNLAYHVAIDALLVGLLKQLRCNRFIVMPNGSVDYRSKFVAETINGLS